MTGTSSKVSRRAALGGFAGAAAGLLGTPSALAAPRHHSTSEPLRVGVVLGTTGLYAEHAGRLLLGVRHRAKLINEWGLGTPSRRVTLFVRDSQGTVDGAREAAAELTEGLKVHALLGASTSLTSAPVIEAAQRLGIPAVMPVAGAAPNQSHVFRSGATLQQIATEIMRAISAASLKKAGLLVTGPAISPGLRDAYQQAAKANGVELGHIEVFDPADTDLSAPLRKLIDAGVDVLVVTAIPPFNGLAVTQARALGWGPDKPIYCAPSAGLPGFLARAGKAAEGVRVAASWLLVYREAPASLPNWRETVLFGATFEAEHGMPGSYLGYGADALGLLAAAFEDTDDVGVARDRLETLAYNGASGRFQMSPGNHAGLSDQALITVVVRNGTWKLDA